MSALAVVGAARDRVVVPAACRLLVAASLAD